MIRPSARAQRRGALSRFEFLAEMDRLGFVEVRACDGTLHKFLHPDRIGVVFSVKFGETYSRALERLALERNRKPVCQEEGSAE